MIAPVIEFADPTHILWQGRRFLYFGGCDYLRLSHHPAVHRELRRGLARLGLNVAASRLTTGNHPVYTELETRLAEFFHAPAAQSVPTGYTSNLIVAQALRGLFSHVLIDERAHASLRDASQFMGCSVRSFAHLSPWDLERKARAAGPRAKLLVMTDGMYAYDGAAAPLREYRAVLPGSAWLLVDDAHGTGVLGATGRGTLEQEGVGFTRTVVTITLSKAFGSYGGAILAPASVRARISRASRLFAGSTPVPLPLATASLAAIELVDAHPEWLDTLRRNTAYVREALRARGIPQHDHPGPIVCLAPPPKRARRLKLDLIADGIYPAFLRYPGGPASGYFRFAISNIHRRSELDQLAKVIISAHPSRLGEERG